jgi:uncharacterized protein YjiS (DUF1127 family)
MSNASANALSIFLPDPLARAQACRSTRRTASRLSLLNLLGLWQQRRALANLPAERLCDLGLTAEAAACEANRPLWDVPSHWRA